MRPPGTGRPRCWVTGPPGGSCSATPSSSSPRNTDSGPGPSSGRTSKASAPPATGRSPACGGRGQATTPRGPIRLLTELRRGDPGALQRLRAYVPRYAAATDASTAELRDARLIIARELGFPTWRELVEGAEKSQRDDAERQEERRRMRPEAEALLAGDTARLAQLTAGQADTLLQMLAMRGAPRYQARRGTRRAPRRRRCADRQGHQPGPPAAPGRPLRPGGVRAAAARRRRRPRHPDRRHHAAGDRHLLWPHAGWSTCSPSTASSRAALWTYAACGRLDLVRACFDADGRLRPDAALRAPTPPTSSRSHPGSRRPTIRRRSWPRRSSTPASTAGPRSCAGSSTAA